MPVGLGLQLSQPWCYLLLLWVPLLSRAPQSLKVPPAPWALGLPSLQPFYFFCHSESPPPTHLSILLNKGICFSLRGGAQSSSVVECFRIFLLSLTLHSLYQVPARSSWCLWFLRWFAGPFFRSFFWQLWSLMHFTAFPDPVLPVAVQVSSESLSLSPCTSYLSRFPPALSGSHDSLWCCFLSCLSYYPHQQSVLPPAILLLSHLPHHFLHKFKLKSS